MIEQVNNYIEYPLLTLWVISPNLKLIFTKMFIVPETTLNLAPTQGT